MIEIIESEDTRNIRSERKYGKYEKYGKYDMTAHEKGWKKRLENIRRNNMIEIINSEDVLEDVCKSCVAHETCDLSTYRVETFWDIDDMIDGCFECDCMKKENGNNWR